MLPNSGPAQLPKERKKFFVGRRLILAAALIGLAIGGLALVDQLRGHPTLLLPPHEPSQALITSPVPQSDALAIKPEQPRIPPPPPHISNRDTVAAASVRKDALTSPTGATGSPGNAPAIPAKLYVVQVGIFNSPANAQALQKQLKLAGIQARLETRVQLGPFNNKGDAEKALARARKLGIDAVLVGSH